MNGNQEKKNVTKVIFCHDGYENHIRELKVAIDMIEDFEKSMEEDMGYTIALLRREIWNEFDAMCSQKYDYDSSEFAKLKIAMKDKVIG